MILCQDTKSFTVNMDTSLLGLIKAENKARIDHSVNEKPRVIGESVFGDVSNITIANPGLVDLTRIGLQ